MATGDQIYSCMLGVAVADALGLPLENMSRKRISRLLRDKPLKHRFLFGLGMGSDDTEHTCLVAQSLSGCGNDDEKFGADLARRLKWWGAGLPAGTGRATIRACFRLWLGRDFRSSGVWSAGNGPAMRAPIIGVAVQDPDRAKRLVAISSLITHSDPKANDGALMIAALAHHFSYADPLKSDPHGIANICKSWLEESRKRTEETQELMGLIDAAASSATNGESTRQYAESMGWSDGVSGYTYHTVPAAIHACMRYPNDYRSAIDDLIRSGGDVDSTAALAGGILAARLGVDSIPADWSDGFLEWPRTKGWMRRLADHLASVSVTDSALTAGELPRANLIGLFCRNLLFLFVVLVHAARRLLPPYS